MSLLREFLGLDWSRWAIVSEGRCVRCNWPHFEKRWHNNGRTVQMRCLNCGAFHQIETTHPPASEGQR